MEEENNTTLDQSKDEGDQEIVTLEDVLNTQEQLTEDAHAVLGAIDDKKCTYDEGYMNRQALYSCLTCIPEARTDFSKSGGVCLACSYYCHDGHELIELYTKRNFRCDCGNSKFSSTCTLNSIKDPINEQNIYNQNFSGVYCTCKRPYPDPEDPVQDDMIQCIICEDWYHSRHLNVEVPPCNSYTEMTCGSCLEKHEFLLYYEGLCVTKVAQEESKSKAETSQSDTSQDKVEGANTAEVEFSDAIDKNTADLESSDAVINKNTAELESSDASINNTILECDTKADEETMNEGIKDVTIENENTSEVKSSDTAVNGTVPDIKIEDADIAEVEPSNGAVPECDSKETKNEDIQDEDITCDCKRPKIKSENASTKFWVDVDWRKNLCTCRKCKEIYEEQAVLFLLDSQDTVPVYEEKGKAKARETEAKQETEFLNSVDRVPLMETIAGFNDMKANLRDYLRKFAENKKVVREEDIREFFSNYDSKKRQRCDIPYNCR